MKKKTIRSGIVGVMVFVLCIVVALCFSRTGKQGTEINTLMESAFCVDTQKILSLFPDRVRERALLDASAVSGGMDEEAAARWLGRDLEHWIKTFDVQFGDGWSYTYEVTDEYVYTKDELKDLNLWYQLMGVTDMKAKAAKLMTISYTLTGQNGNKGDNRIFVCLIKERGGWKIGQGIGSVYQAAAADMHYDLFGDLLNGFTIAGIEGDEGGKVEIRPESELSGKDVHE